MTSLQDAADRTLALTDFDRNLVITAGAGTGKTSLLTGRLLCALIGKEMEPKAVLVTTFTEKAAGEMAERVEESMIALATGEAEEGSDASRAEDALLEHFGLDAATVRARASALLDRELPTIETFHAFCLRVLGEFAREAELPPDVRIGDELDMEELFDEFWIELLESELGPEGPGRRRRRILDVDSWDTLIGNPGLNVCKRALREWCTKPLLTELELDVEVEPLRESARDIVAAFDELLPNNPQPNKFEECTVPAIEAARRLLALEPGRRPDAELVAECAAYSRLYSLPTISKRTPEGPRAVLKDLQKRLQRTLHSWTMLPDPRSVAALERLCRDAGTQFEQRKASRSLLSFEDCLVRCYRLLRSHAHVRTRLRDRFTQLLVDEFQDTDPLQYDIVFYLAQASEPVANEDPRAVPLNAGRLCIVGDPKQSIYRFRGADMEAFARAKDRLIDQSGGELHLTVNFRSQDHVLDLVNATIGPLMQEEPGFQPAYEELVPFHVSEEEEPAGTLLLVRAGGSMVERREAEARALAEYVKARVSEDEHRCYRDFAFLFRAFTDAELYARELRSLEIPVLVEGGKRFYDRHEVERFLSVLLVLLRPYDEAAAVALLRGPLGAVPDADLVACARVGISPGRVFVLPIATLENLELPRIVAVRQEIDSIRARIADLSPADVLRDVLRSTLLAPVEAAGYDGAQRLANLEALTEKVAKWSADGVHDLNAVVERLAREARGQVEAEESPLADPGTDAVRLLTIHKAKGLEFEVVVVPDIGREPKGSFLSEMFYILRDPRDRDRALLRLDSMQSPRIAEVIDRNERHETAEELRLVYVALTRARESLVLSCTKPGHRNVPWMAALRELGIDLKKPPASGELKGGLVFTSLDAETSRRGALRIAEFSLAPTLACVTKRREEIQQSRAHVRSAMRAPSETPEKDGLATVGSSSLPLAVGSTVHDYLLGCDFASTELDAGRLEAIAAANAARVSDPRAAREVFDAAAEALEAFLASELRTRIATCRLLHQEMPILYRDADGERWHGSVDLVIEEAGQVVIADFKTDRVDETSIAPRAESYAPQMRIYAAAVQAAWRLDEAPRTELFFVRPGLAIAVE